MGIRRAEFDRCFDLEALEPRVMLSGEGAPVLTTTSDTGSRIELPAESAGESADSGSGGGFGMLMAALTAESTGPVWINAAGGDWSVAANWQDGTLPAADADVVIDGLDEGAVITLTGDTPALNSLTIESGTVVIDGALTTNELTIRSGATLEITGAGSSAIGGTVLVETGASLKLTGTSVVAWSAGDDVDWDNHGAFTMAGGTELRLTNSGNFNQQAGLMHVADGAQVTLADTWSNFFVRGGELRLDGTVDGVGSNAEFGQTGGTISGSGVLSNPRPITLKGVISPGTGDGDTGWLQIAADVSLADDWAVHLDILDANTATSASMDILTITGAVTFGGTGRVTLDAAAADFGAVASGTRVGDANGLFYINGTATGAPAIAILPGAEHTVTAAWNGTNLNLDVETYSPITATWINAAGGDWGDSANWSNGRLPVAGEDVTLSGLNSDATITLTGDTPVLASLSLDGGTLAITGALSVGNLTVTGDATLNLSGAGDSAITGDVSFAAGTSFNLGAGADLTWSGATWRQGGFAQVVAGATFTQTSGRFETGAADQFAVNGTLILNGGEFVIPTAASSLNLYNGAQLNVGAATITLNGGLIAAFNESVVVLGAGSLLRGAGEFRVNEQLTVSGTIAPGSTTSRGTLQFTLGEDNVAPTITFADTWALQLDVVGASDLDLISFIGNVTFGASGSIAVNATAADFTGTPNGTALDPLVRVTGTVTGTPAASVTDGSGDHSVQVAWSGQQLDTTTDSVVMTAISQAVSAGLAAGTTTFQAMLADYNLGNAFTLPGLSLDLADALNLTALSAQVALPSIQPSATLAELIGDLETAGFTVTQPGDGVELRAVLTRTVADGLALAVDADQAFAVPADTTAGWADELDLSITGALTASLSQTVVFEVRDGAFVLAVDPAETSRLVLDVSGTAQVAGSATSGGRTVSIAGDITVSYVVGLHHQTGGNTAAATGTSSIELTTSVGALDLTIEAAASRTADATTLVTTAADTLNLDGVLNFNGLTDSDGTPLTLTLTGVRAGDSGSWNLAVAGTDARLMGLSVTDWDLGANLSPTTFAGAGTLDISFDFLRVDGAAPEVALSASFDADALALDGAINGTVGIASPGGSSYLLATNFAGAVDLSVDFGTSSWTGPGLVFTAASATFGAPGTTLPGTVTDGADADAFALTGTYDFGTQTVTTTLDQFELVADTVVRLAVAGVALRHTRNGSDEQELGTAADVPVELLFLTVAPATGPPSFEASSITLRTDGVAIGAGSVTLGDITLGAGVALRAAQLGVGGISFAADGITGDNVSLTADSAALFGDNAAGYTLTATSLTGSYDFSVASDRLALTADNLDFALPGRLAFSATGAVLRPDGDTIWAATDLAATVPYFNLPGELSTVALTSTGEVTTEGLTLDASGLTERLLIGGLLPLAFDQVTAHFAGDTNNDGVYDSGETWNLAAFDLVATGAFDFAVLNTLPFDATISIGDTDYTSADDAVSITLQWMQDAFVPWQTDLVALGINETAVGTAFTLSGRIELGRYTAGEWVAALGGSVTLGAGELSTDLSGDTGNAVAGDYDAAAGTLTLGGQFTVAVTLGERVTLLGLDVDWALNWARDGEGGLSATTLVLSGGDNAAVTTRLGDMLELTTSEAQFDFMATGTDAIMIVANANMLMRGIGIEGYAKNFGLNADGSLRQDAGFEIGTKLSAVDLLWPEWLPIGVVEAYLQWDDFQAAPDVFTLRFSVFVTSNKILGTNLTIAGSIDEAVFDPIAFDNGQFPIVSLAGVGFSIEGEIGGAKVKGALLLGVARVSADGEIIAPGDVATPVMDRVLWGAIQAGLEIESVGGFEIWLGLSELGPLQGYVRAGVPVVVEPTTGLTLNNFRAGITFNTALPATTDAHDLRLDPNFSPIGQLAFNDWQDIMLASVATQIAAHAEGGTMAVLANPFRLDGGATIYSSYVSEQVFKVEADFAMDSTGKFFARGQMTVGDAVSLTATLYFDLSRFVSDGEAVILFLADVPSEFPVLTVYGGLTFNFGVEIDPENPPANALEQVSVTISGGWELGLPEVPAVTVEGSVRFDLVLNAPSLRTVVEGSANIIGLGDVVSLAGDMDLYFGADETVELVGVVALAPGDFTVLQDLGLNFDGVAVLRFNTTDTDATRELTLPAEETPRTFTAPAHSAGILMEGWMGFSLFDVELYRMDGAFSFVWSGDTFDVLAAGVLTAGPAAAPLLRLDANGYLKVVFTGIDVGLAALFQLSLNEGDDAFSSIGIEVGGAIEFRLNTTGQDVDYTLAGAEAGSATVDRIYLPRGPPAPDGTPAESASPYAVVRAAGTLAVLDVITLEGVFDFTVSGESIDLNYDASLAVSVADTPLLIFAVDGHFRLDAAGLYGEAVLQLTNDASAATAPLGFSFNATYRLQVNTTGAEQTIDGKTLSAGTYARIVATGELATDGIVLSGEFTITVDGDGLAFAATGTLSLGVGDVELIELGYEGDLQVFSDGIYASLTLSRTADGSEAFGFGFSATSTYTLELNTTPIERSGVPAGLGAQVTVTGTLQVGDVSLDGVYVLTATTTGIGFAASAALIFRDGDSELFRLPVEFAIEMDIPGIAEHIALDIDPAALGLTIPGFDLAGSFYLEVNTTASAVGEIPAGPIFRAGFDGALTLGSLELEGEWFFDASLSRTQIGGSFELSLGVPGEDAMVMWTGSADFNLGLNGVAGYAALTVDHIAAPLADILDGDFAFELLVNTSTSELTVGERTLPAGPIAAVQSSGTLNVGGFDLTGEFYFSASPAGLNIEADATLSVTVGDALTLFSFGAVGGFTLDGSGIAAAMDLTLAAQAWSNVGLTFAGGSAFRLRINTTGAARVANGIDLAAGDYARIEFNGGLGLGTFALEGEFALSAANSTADLTIDGALVAQLPGVDTPAFRLGAVGGLHIDPAGVAAAFDLDASLTGGSIEVEGIDMPFGSEQTVSLRLNTTGEERTAGGITLEAGNYFSFRTTGQIFLGPYVLSGEFGFTAADTGFAVDASATFGVGVAEVQFLRFDVSGEIQVTAAGTYAALTLATEAGDGFDDFGFGFGAGASFTLAFNATDNAINGIPAHSPWALRVVGMLALGDSETDGAELVGSFTLTPTVENTLLLHGETSFVLSIDGTTWVDLPFEFDHEIEAPGLAFRVDLIDVAIDDVEIPGVSFEDGAFYLQFNVGSEPVDFGSETIPAGPIFELVYTGTLKIGWANLDGEFAFSASGSGVAMNASLALRFGDRENPYLQLGGAGAFQVDRTGFSGYLALTATGGIDSLIGPFGGEITHELYLNTRDEIVEVNDVELPAGPMAELRSTGALVISGLAFNGTMITRGSAEGFTMGVDANLEIRVPLADTVLLSIPVLGGFTIGPQGFSAALDVTPTTATFEPVGLIFGGAATYRLRINTTGEARNENGIDLEAGNYARIDATGTMSLGVLAITGGYSIQADTDLLRVGVNGEAVLTVPGDGVFNGELLRIGVGGQLGIGPGGVVGALDAAVGAGAPQFALGDWSLPVGAELASRIRLNTTGTERVIEGYTMAANETFIWEVSGGVTVGALRLEGLNRFTAGHELVRWENTGRAAILSPLTGAAEVIAGEGTVGMEISAAGVAGVATLAGSPTSDGAVDLGLGLDFEAELDLRFNTTGAAVTIGDVTLEAGNYFEAGVSGELELLGQRIDGTHFLRVSDGAVGLRSEGTLTIGLPDVLTMTFGTDITFVFADDGVYGTAALTVGTTAFSASGADLVIDGSVTPILAVNTSGTAQTFDDTTLAARSVSVGLGLDITLLGQTFSGQAALTVDDAQGLVVLRHEGTLNLGIAGWTPFTFEHDGYFLFGEGGVATNLNLTVTGGIDVAGASFSGSWSLRASTFDAPVSVPGFSVGGLNVPAIAIEQSPMLRVHLDGTLGVGGMTLSGAFDFEMLSDRFVLHSDFSISALGISMGGSGQLWLSDAGVVADVSLSGPNVSNSIYTMSGDYVLQLNTTDSASGGIPANHVRIAVNDAVIAVPGATFRGSASIDFEGGVTLRVDGMTATLDVPMLGGATMTINGWMNTAGLFNVTGTTTLAVGDRNTFGIFGTTTITISHDQGIRGTISGGELQVPGDDYAYLNGSFTASATAFELNVEQTAFTLLGGVVRVDGAFRVTWTDGVFDLWVNDAVLTTRIPGWNTTVTVNGWVSSNGNFDLNGTAELNVGSYPPNEDRVTLEERDWTLGLRGAISLNVSQAGISGSTTGYIFIPGDWAGYSGSFSAGSWGFDLEAHARFVLLGGAVLLDGGIMAELRDGTLTFGLVNMTAESRIPGLESGFTINGWINSAGEFYFAGDASLAMGSRSTAGIFGAVHVEVSNADGIYAAISDAELVVPGGSTARFDGYLRQSGDTFELDIDHAEFTLMGGVASIAGSFRVEIGENWVELTIREATAAVNLPGFNAAWSVTGWINSDGGFDLRGFTSWDFRVAGQRVASGDLEVWLRSSAGLEAWITNGDLFVPGGDYGRLSGYMSLSDDHLIVDVNTTAFVLLGGLVRVDGSFRAEISSDFMQLDIRSATVRLGLTGFDSAFSVSGYVNSAGGFDLRGTASLNVGGSSLGLQGSVSLRISSSDGIRGDFNATLRVPGTSTSVSGSLEAGSWGFNLAINRASFSLLGGAVTLDGAMLIELRSGTLTMYLDDVSARIGGFIDLNVSGVIRSDGFFDLDGTARLQLGHWSTVEISGESRINIRSDYGVRAWLDLTVYVRYQEVAALRDVFTYIGRDGFGISISSDFGFGDAWTYGTLNLEVRRDGLSASFSGDVYLWGFRGGISGWFNSVNGTWRLSGSVGFSVGGTVGASGRIEIDVGHDRFNFSARGEAWAGFYIPVWHATPKWYNWFDGHWDDEWIGGSTSFSVGFDAGSGSFSVSVLGKSVHIRFKGGFRVWLSNVGGSTVFLDVNRNGVLDDGEPFTVADGNGNFSFDDDAATESSGSANVLSFADMLGSLAAYDLNGNGFIDGDEGLLYATDGTTTSAITSGAPSGQSGRPGATIFLDANGNGVPDMDEPSVTADALGLYTFATTAVTTISPLGELAGYDANGDGILDVSEIRLYAVNGLQPADENSTVRLFRDANGNGTYDTGEVFADVTLAELGALGQAAAAGNAPAVSSTPLRVFDTDGDGVMEESEGQNLVSTTAGGVRVPLTEIDPLATGALPLTDVEFVFADVNGNGIYDVGEPRVTPNANGVYTFASGLERDAAAGLGRLAPFDRNGNGRIDPDEGVFVVQGGVDNDNGLTNPVAASGLASGYGSGIEQTINPLSSLQVALVNQGVDEAEAAEIIAGALGLPGDVDLATFNPMADNGLGAATAEGATLGAGATITSLITAGAGLLGDSSSASAQNTVLQSLASVLVAGREGGEGYSLVNLTNTETLNRVLEDAATSTGRALDVTAVNAAATVIAAVNTRINETVAQGGDVNRNLAATKAVVLTTVANTLTDLGAGRVTAAEVESTLSADALNDLIGRVTLRPTAAPTLGNLADITARGGDRILINLPVTDSDSRLSDLQFSLATSTDGVINLDAASFVYDNGGWHLVLPAAIVSQGSTDVTVSVSDGSTTANRTFRVTLNGINNTVQLIDAVPGQTLVDGQTIGVDLSDYFADPDGNATYVLNPVGGNRVVDARIVGGQLVLTANGNLAGVAVFDLVATDNLGTATTRFSVITYPSVLVGGQLRYDADGQAGIAINLSVPSTQTLVLNYRSGNLSGIVVFAAGETGQIIPVDVTNLGTGGAMVSELELGVNGSWVNGTFTVALNSYSAVELLDLRRTTGVAVQFTLAYRFVEMAEGEEDSTAIVLDPLLVTGNEPVVIAVTVLAGTGQTPAAGAGNSALEAAASLKSWEQPRALHGI